MFVITREFCIRRNDKKVNSIEIGRVATAHLLTWSDLEKYKCTFLINDDEILLSLLKL